jgi:hypothetical protein
MPLLFDNAKYIHEPDGWAVKAGPLAAIGRRTFGTGSGAPGRGMTVRVVWGAGALDLSWEDAGRTSRRKFDAPVFSSIYGCNLSAWEQLWIYVDTNPFLLEAAMTDAWSWEACREVMAKVNRLGYSPMNAMERDRLMMSVRRRINESFAKVG